MTVAAYARCIDASCQLCVFPHDVETAQHEMNVRHLFMQASRGPNEIAMIFMRMEAGCHSNDRGIWRDTKLLAERRARAGVRLQMIQIETVRDDLQSVACIAELLV